MAETNRRCDGLEKATPSKKRQCLVHPGRLTWNLRIHPWKRKIIFQTIIFRLYVNLPGCIHVRILGFTVYTQQTSQGAWGRPSKVVRSKVPVTERLMPPHNKAHPVSLDSSGEALKWKKQNFRFGNSAVENQLRLVVGSLSPYIYRVFLIHPIGGWEWDF